MDTDSSQPPKPCFYDVIRMYNFAFPLQEVAAMARVNEEIVEAMCSGDVVRRVYARKVLAALSEYTGVIWTLDTVRVALLPSFQDFHALSQFDLEVLSTTSGVSSDLIRRMLRSEPIPIKEARSVLQAASKQTGQNYTMSNIDIEIDKEEIEHYKTGNDCLLCGKYPSNIFQSEYFFVLYDDFPLRLGHVLLIPIRHVESLILLTCAEFCDLHFVIQQMIKHIKVEFQADGYNIGFNGGDAAGQTLPHLHFHLVPRRFGDVLDPRGGIRKFLPNPLTEYLLS